MILSSLGFEFELASFEHSGGDRLQPMRGLCHPRACLIMPPGGYTTALESTLPERCRGKLSFVLERERDPGAESQYLAALDLHVHLRDFGDAQVAYGFRRGLYGALGGHLPKKRGADAHDIDDLGNFSLSLSFAIETSRDECAAIRA